MQFETFAPLARLTFITHAFTLRGEEDTRADDFESVVLKSLGFPPRYYASAEQTHGNAVAIVTKPVLRIPAVDALITSATNLPLMIRCADCAGVFIVDCATPAIAMIHSGKRGTLANVTGNAVTTMREVFGTDPQRCIAAISPSIGPCHYEMDIWSGIEAQLREAGVSEIYNSRVCTACHPDRYFSYRAEHGPTGRMFALLALRAR